MMNATINSMEVFAATVKEAVEASLGEEYEVNIKRCTCPCEQKR